VQYQVFQRDGANQADIAITGTYTGNPTYIQARFNGGAWATIDASPSGGTFSGTLSNQAAGQGTLEVRLEDSAKTDSVANIGIGDIFAISGQSNASGRGTNNQSYSHATLKATLFGNDYVWHDLTDPTDTSSSQVDAVSDDDALPAGSYWPLLASQIMTATGFPVAFVPCAKGGSSFSDWQASTDHSDRATLYGSMNYRISQVGGVKAVLMHEGEQDADVGTAEATVNALLDSFANDVNTDQSIKVMPCKLQTCSSIDVTTVNSAIGTAWGDNSNVLTGPDLSSISVVLHLESDTDLQDAADLWFTELETSFGW